MIKAPGGLVAFTLILAALAPSAPAQDAATRFGPQDTIGALNLLTADHVRGAAGLVTEGRVYSLGIVSGPATPAWGERSFRIEITAMGPLGENKVTAHDDRLVSHLGIGTQIDGFAHIGVDGTHYNGYRAEDFSEPDGVKVFGAESIPPIVARGVLLDVAALQKVDRLPARFAITAGHLADAARAQDIDIRSGDVVLVHTGWLSMAAEDPGAFIDEAPGIDVAAATYLADRGAVAIGADTAGLEVAAAGEPGHLFPVHELLLVHRGIHILENVDSSALARDGAHEFMFVLGQPKIQGAVQTIINPIAIR